MENPWSSPWTADEPEGAASERAGPAAKFGVAEPSSPWVEEGDVFGGWGVGGRGDGDVGGLHGELEKDGGGGDILGEAGLGAAHVEPLPSPSAGADPWAAEVSAVDAGVSGNIAPSEEGALEGEVLGCLGFADRPGDTTAAATTSLEPPLTPLRAEETVADNRATSSPVPTSPERTDSASPDIDALGRSSDAVAPLVLSHDDAPLGREGTRQVSKVQELVDMYDGIAKDVSEQLEHTPSKRPPRAASHRPDESDEAEDWEEFEVGDQKASDGAPPAPTATPTSPTLPSPADFNIDEATLTTLLESLFDTTEPPAPPADLPDNPDRLEAFTTTERRAWYRLSRQGSARLHDAGDPDNYARAGWHGSAVSAETFGIVRRWMQEGGMRARAGGGREAARFGWEASSSSDPVDLSFLKRRSTGGSGVSVPKPDTVKAPVNAGGARPLSVPSPPKGPNAAPPEPRPKPTRPSPLVFAQREADTDEEEEWGEMVSSPQATASFGTAADSRADSAVSFGKSGSGSSLDSRPGARPAPDGRGGKPQGDHVGIISPTSLGHPHTAVETLPARPQAAAARADVRRQDGHMEAVGGVIARLPDLSYMLR